MDFQNLLLSVENHVALLTINREKKLNALNGKTLDEIEAAFGKIYDDPEIKGVIITGAGNKAFVAGADISEIAEVNYMTARKFSEKGQEIFAKIENCPKPVIAAVNGYALGGGCELAMACHIRVGSENAHLGLPEVKLGIIPGYGGTQRLTKLVGKGKAFEMVLTGEPITASEAHSIGLLNYMVTSEELMTKCNYLMNKILGNATLAVAQAIDCINDVFTSEDGYQTEANSFGNCCKTEDFKEGTKAFLEKRRPKFKGI